MSKPLTRAEQREVDILLKGDHVYGQCWASRTLFREVVRLRAALAAAEGAFNLEQIAHAETLTALDNAKLDLAAAEAKLELQGYEYTKALAEVELALGADIHALDAKLADERKDLGIALELLAEETRDLCPDCAAVDHIEHAHNCGYRELFARYRARRNAEKEDANVRPAD